MSFDDDARPTTTSLVPGTLITVDDPATYVLSAPPKAPETVQARTWRILAGIAKQIETAPDDGHFVVWLKEFKELRDAYYEYDKTHAHLRTL